MFERRSKRVTGNAESGEVIVRRLKTSIASPFLMSGYCNHSGWCCNVQGRDEVAIYSWVSVIYASPKEGRRTFVIDNSFP